MSIVDILKEQGLNVKNLEMDLPELEGEVYETYVSIPLIDLKHTPTLEEIWEKQRKLAKIEKDLINAIGLFQLAAEMYVFGIMPDLSEKDWQNARDLVRDDTSEFKGAGVGVGGKFTPLSTYMEILRAEDVEIVEQPSGPLSLTTLKLTKIVYNQKISQPLPMPEERSF